MKAGREYRWPVHVVVVLWAAFGIAMIRPMRHSHPTMATVLSLALIASVFGIYQLADLPQ
jgi:hypothetical protein